MPIYEYTCGKCNHAFEQLVRTMTPDAKTTCPACGSAQTARSMSLFAVSTAGPSSGGGSEASPMCGRCGGAPGSCGMD